MSITVKAMKKIRTNYEPIYIEVAVEASGTKTISDAYFQAETGIRTILKDRAKRAKQARDERVKYVGYQEDFRKNKKIFIEDQGEFV